MKNISVCPLLTLALTLGAGLLSEPASALPIVVTDESPRSFPFGGHLEQDGVPVDAVRPMQFTIVDAADAVLWTSALKDVVVTAGAFGVVLGDANDPVIPDAVFGPTELYVRVTVDSVALGGRQRLLSTPFAVRATSAYEASEGGPLQQQIASLQAQIDELVAGVGSGIGVNNTSSPGTVLDIGTRRAIYSTGTGDYRWSGFNSCTNGRIFTVGDLNSVITVQHDACGGTPGCFPLMTNTGANKNVFFGGHFNFICSDGKWFEFQ